MVETSNMSSSEEFPLASDSAEGEAVLAFEPETNGELIHEPVEQS
jgi:hypothetical protein